MSIHPSELNAVLETGHPASGHRGARPVFRGGRADLSKSFYHRVLKRPVDLLVILLTLPFWLPIIAISALAIFLSDGGKPFYRQARIGRDGRRFALLKLRTMVPDADARLEAYLADNPRARAEWTRSQKLKRDPRITRVGRLLRRTSLDELPQILNVIMGEMSIVGPRPMMECQDGLYHGKSYYDLRPGMTGFWQISDRNSCGFADRVLYDDAYARLVSLRVDLLVLWRTVAVVLRGTGY